MKKNVAFAFLTLALTLLPAIAGADEIESLQRQITANKTEIARQRAIVSQFDQSGYDQYHALLLEVERQYAATPWWHVFKRMRLEREGGQDLQLTDEYARRISAVEDNPSIKKLLDENALLTKMVQGLSAGGSAVKAD